MPLTWKALAQVLDRRAHLLLADSLVFLALGGRLQALPRQRTAQEVHEHVAKRLHVVTPRLLCEPTNERTLSPGGHHKTGIQL